MKIETLLPLGKLDPGVRAADKPMDVCAIGTDAKELEMLGYDGLVVEGSTFVLAEADQHHFVKPALNLSNEAGVWFDASNDGNVVGLEGVFVKENRNAVFGLADLDCFHR